MKLFKNSIYILCVLSFPCLCYTQSITYKQGIHVPLIIILEQNNNEIPSMSKLGPETRDLEMGILEQRAPILVSKPIFYNFIYRKHHWDDPKHNENQLFKDIPFTNDTWELYEPRDTHYFTGNTQLYLLIPKAQKDLFRSELFNRTALQQLDILPSKGNNDYTQLIALLKPQEKEEQETTPKKEIVHDLKKIFATFPSANKENLSLSIHYKETWENPIWDIFLSGHGLPKPDSVIAALTPLELQEVLTFFNNFMRVGVLILVSCYSGGENLNNIKFNKDINNNKVFSPLNFIIIVNSVGDIGTLPSSYAPSFAKKTFFTNIFDSAQHLGDGPSHSLEKLLGILSEVNPAPKDIHSQASIPQVILPGGIEIQSLTASDSVMVLGKVKVRVAELEHKPMQIYPKKLSNNPEFNHVLNVLVYPSTITVPLLLRSSHLPPSFNLKELIKTQWLHLPTFSELVTRNEEFFNEEKLALFTKKIDVTALKHNHYLYPNIISMIHGNASHYFSAIVFEGNALTGSGGLLMGLRDAFCNLTERPTKKYFYIDRVEGPNDISLILKAIQAIAPHDYPLILELPGDGDPTILHNVYIETHDEYGMVVVIKFQINNTAWEYKYEAWHWESPEVFKPRWWNFRSINAKDYEKKFKELKHNIIRSGKSLRIKKKQKPLTSIFRTIGVNKYY